MAASAVAGGRRMRVLARRIASGALMCSAIAASTIALVQSTFFRFEDLDLRDPHVFVSAFGSCLDVTSSTLFGLPSINGEIQDSIRNDGDGDGLLDQSTVIEFLPLDRTLALNLMDSGAADCTAPLLDRTTLELRTELPSLRHEHSSGPGSAFS